MHEDRLVNANDLVLLKDIAERTGMNPTKLSNLATARRRTSGFPCPVSGQGSRGIWLWSEVEAWWYQEYVRPVPSDKPPLVRQRHRAA
jgi:hypothetical protein